MASTPPHDGDQEDANGTAMLENQDLRKALLAKEEEILNLKQEIVQFSNEVSKLKKELIEIEARKEAEAEKKLNQLRRLMLTGLKISGGGGGDGVPELFENEGAGEDNMLKEVMRLICGEPSSAGSEFRQGESNEGGASEGEATLRERKEFRNVSSSQRRRLEGDEGLQKKMEGEQRQKYDQMRKVAAKSVKQLKSRMSTALEARLRNHLTVFTSTNVAEIGSIYDELLKEILNEGQSQVDSSLWGELAGIIDEECKRGCFTFIREVWTPILEFNEAMKGKFSSGDICYSTSTLEQIGKAEIGKVSANLPPDQSQVSKLVQIGCEKRMTHFISQNKGIVEGKLGLAKASYQEEMGRLLEEDVYAPSKLNEMHSGLVDKIIASFEGGFQFQTNSNSQTDDEVSSKVEMLRASFCQEFTSFLKRNDSKVKMAQKKIAQILQKSKSSYVKKIENVLTRNPEGMEAREFQRKHQEIETEARKLLEMDIRGVRRDEPSEEYLKALQAYIDDYWKCVLPVNEKNVTKRKEGEKDRKLAGEFNRLLSRHGSNGREPPRPIFKTVTPKDVVRKSQPVPKSTDDRPKLPPLVFQLQHTRIKMGMFVDGKPRILKNGSGEESTPFIVGLTKEGKLIYGSEVLADLDLRSGGDSSQPNLREYWCVAEHFISETWNALIQLNNDDSGLHKISVEFLLAFILSKMKERVETDMKGTCSVAIITVPFWFSSTQRTQVKDGGRLAGFSEIYLVNEAAATAFACASSELRSSSAQNIVIISENAEHVDASIYAWSSGARRVTMVGHCGSYSLEEAKPSGLLGAIWKVSQVLLYGGQRGDEDVKVQNVRRVCKDAITQAFDPKYNTVGDISRPNEMLVITESDKWKPILEQVGREISRKVCDIDEENAVILGATLLSQKPLEIKERIRDKLAWDVLRKCGSEVGSVIIGKQDLLPVGGRRATTYLPVRTREGELIQRVMGHQVSAGVMQLQRSLSSPGQQAEIYLHISNEAIVELTDVVLISSHTTLKEYVPESQYTWATPF